MVRRNSKSIPKRSNKMLGRRRSRRSGRRRSSVAHYTEIIPISVQTGSTLTLTYKHLTNRPQRSNFRVQYVHFVGVASNNGACIQLQIRDESGDFVGNSGPVVMSTTTPRNVKVHTPRSTNWQPYNTSGDDKFADLSVACLVKGGTGSVSGVMHVLVRFGTEFIENACPKLQDFIDNNILTGDVADDCSGFTELSME